jgi:hypothetical protein
MILSMTSKRSESSAPPGGPQLTLNQGRGTVSIASAPSHPAVKRAIVSVLHQIPLAIKRAFVRRAALAPPLLKTPIFERLCIRMSDPGMDGKQLIETNLGLTSRLRCQGATLQSTVCIRSAAKRHNGARYNRFSE